MNSSGDLVRVLLSEGSSNSARQALYGLGPKYSIDLVDPSPLCQCRFSSLVRRRIPCPRIAQDPEGYLRAVARLVEKKRYQVLFPTHEQVYAFSKFRELFSRHVGLAVPSFEAIQRVQSKANFIHLLNELGLPTPPSRIVRSRSELAEHDQFPTYVKLAHSTASLGVQRVSGEQEFHQVIARFEQAGVWKEGQEIVLQQPAVGRQSEACGAFQNGRLVGVACTDVLKTGIGGGPVMRRSAHHPNVVGHLERLGSHLNWHGPISVEYFYDHETEQPYYIESNPRIGESMNPQLSGVNLCEATVRIALGEKVERLPPGEPGVISHNGFITMIADAFNGASRKELLAHLWDHWSRRDVYESEMTRPAADWLSWIPSLSVIALLLVAPRTAKGLATGTVDNYSLPYRAATVIDHLSEDCLHLSED